MKKQIQIGVVFCMFLLSFTISGQNKLGTNPTTINSNAVLELESTSKGLLLPRLALSATNNVAPLAAHVAGMAVYNTAIAGTSPYNVTPGYYFNDGAKWCRIAIANERYGDVKTGIQTADHDGWIKLDGRLKSSLSATQQVQATALGIGTNLPDATGSFLVQNGTTLGSVSGSSSKTIAQANLPNVTLTSTSVSAGTPAGTLNTTGSHDHDMILWASTSGTGFQGVYATPAGTFSKVNIAGNGNQGVQPAGSHTHTFTGSALAAHSHTVPLGGSGTALDVTPKSLSVNMFIYLGN